MVIRFDYSMTSFSNMSYMFFDRIAQIYVMACIPAVPVRYNTHFYDDSEIILVKLCNSHFLSIFLVFPPK